jgi:hypothetical protein
MVRKPRLSGQTRKGPALRSDVPTNALNDQINTDLDVYFNPRQHFHRFLKPVSDEQHIVWQSYLVPSASERRHERDEGHRSRTAHNTPRGCWPKLLLDMILGHPSDLRRVTHPIPPAGHQLIRLYDNQLANLITLRYKLVSIHLEDMSYKRRQYRYSHLLLRAAQPRRPVPACRFSARTGGPAGAGLTAKACGSRGC